MRTGTTGLWLVLCLAACDAGGGSGREASADECSDGADNDGDGATDCEDVRCGVYEFCRVGAGDGGPGAPADAGSSGFDAGPSTDAGAVVPGCSEPLDVVFVIDVSTSMADEVASIRRGVDSIWAAATALSSNAQLGLVVFVDDVAVVNDCAPFASQEAMQSELMRWQEFTSSNGQPGGASVSNSDCPENSLDALHAAATRCPWRPGSTRVAIHVTDDTFEERPATLSEPLLGGGGVDVQHTYAETVAALVDREIRVGAFAAPGAGEECGAGSSPDVGRGFHAPFMGMPSIPDATGARAWSIREVRAGSLDMATAINDLLADEYCTLF
jgi:hypothetical protein